MATNTISDLPAVSYRRSQRARYLRITVDHSAAVMVTIPRNGTQLQAERFMKSKVAWIKKQLHKIEQYDQPHDMQDETVDLEKEQRYLLDRLEYFSKEFGMSYKKVAFRCQRTKWGSCSANDNISLNVNMCFLPKRLQDYLILHELVHTRVKNHSNVFWNQLDKYTAGKAKELSKQLKKYRMRIRK